VCLGLPGALPVLNRVAVDYAVCAALSLGCEVQERSVFARKNYFYPDLPKGYQISQYEWPLARGGGLEIEVGGRRQFVRLTRIHMEEDAGKSLHEGFADSDRKTYLDFNRSGVPLIEIVSEPDMRSAEAAATFFEKLRQMLVWLGVNDGNMEEGSLRCDANVSVRPAGDAAFGTKAEVKNVNSFRYLQKALEFEIARHQQVIGAGGRVRQETRLWNSDTGETMSMRSKEEAHDYRYFPEPDLPPLVVDADWIDEIRASMPELPDARVRRFVAAYGVSDYDADVLVRSPGAAEYFEAAVAAGAPAKAASNWLQGEVKRMLKDRGAESMAEVPITPAALAQLIALVDGNVISSSVAKTVFEEMWTTGRGAREIVDRDGLAQIGDEAALKAVVDDVLARHPDAVAELRAGRTNVLGFLVGQAMKATAGKGNPRTVSELVRRAVQPGPI
jgi:aspartyl-tRNA(Asn)/glutamyl-tRNA(Gln) amidotransferase subunit B